MRQSHSETERWLIVADDRTGAADAAIPFANRGLQTTVGWQIENPPDLQTAVYSHDADTRHLPPEIAARKFRDAVQLLLPTRAPFFKKIDSTLRGQIAAETAATLDLFRQIHGSAFAILAPAYPAMGRTTQSARVFLHGKPLEENPLWQRDHTYPTTDLADILQTANIACEGIPVDLIRQGPEPLRKRLAAIKSQRVSIAICDAEKQSDLDTIAAAVRAIGVAPMRGGRNEQDATFFIGSAGLAHALAKTVPQIPLPPLPQLPDKRGTLIVIGSFAEPSRTAADVLSQSPSVITFPIPIESLLAEAAASTQATKIIAVLQDSRDALVLLTAARPPDPALHGALAQALAELLAPVAGHFSSLVVTGGQTAAAIFGALRISAIRLLQEIDPAMPLGLTVGNIQIPAVTKSGAFGNEQSLLRILHRLREIRQIRCHP